MTSQKPTVLITGATGQIGGDTLRLLQNDDSITLVAAVRSTAKAQPFEAQGIRSVIMDFDKEETLAPAWAVQDILDLFALPFNHHPVVESGLRAEEAQALLQAFFLRLREQRAAKPRWKPPVTP